MTITNFIFSYLPALIAILLLKLILEDLLADLSPLVLTSCCQEWQLADLPADLSPRTDTLWSRMAIGRLAGRSIPQMHHGIYIMGYIWQPFWILQDKVGISSYFSIIRVVNSQLALYSHVRCNLLNTRTTPSKHPLNDNYKFQL